MRMIDDCRYHLVQAGIAMSDADALRRIAMTLHRWHELECGDGNSYGSWAIERGEETEKPYLVHHHYAHGRGQDSVSRTPIADREAGAKKRLAAIMAKYPGYQAYVQGDPRGAALYILHPNAIAGADAFSTDEAKRAEWLSANYTRGIAVFK